jgi:dihydropteroate synthase
MGIINVTPDSFSDGGQFFEPARAVDHALQLAQEGADILDIGGESTRPYSQSVDADQQWRRVKPVIQQLVDQTKVPISIDTSKASVARAAVDAGAEIINDVTGLTGDPDMIKVAVESGVGVCAMHMQGTPQTMQDNPQYDDVLADIFQYLAERKQALLSAGIGPNRICLDPGIGFGKTHTHNLHLIRGARRFHLLGCPILVGHSRKGFIGKAIGNKDEDRLAGSVAVSLMLARQAIQVLRVHDVAQTRQALLVFDAIGGIDGHIADLG